MYALQAPLFPCLTPRLLPCYSTVYLALNRVKVHTTLIPVTAQPPCYLLSCHSARTPPFACALCTRRLAPSRATVAHRPVSMHASCLISLSRFAPMPHRPPCSRVTAQSTLLSVVQLYTTRCFQSQHTSPCSHATVHAHHPFYMAHALCTHRLPPVQQPSLCPRCTPMPYRQPALSPCIKILHTSLPPCLMHRVTTQSAWHLCHHTTHTALLELMCRSTPHCACSCVTAHSNLIQCHSTSNNAVMPQHTSTFARALRTHHVAPVRVTAQSHTAVLYMSTAYRLRVVLYIPPRSHTSHTTLTPCHSTICPALMPEPPTLLLCRSTNQHVTT